MSLESFKSATFKNDNVSVIRVPPCKVDTLDQLPMIAFNFMDKRTRKMEMVGYNIILHNNKISHHNQELFRTIGRQMMIMLEGLDVTLDPKQRKTVAQLDKFFDCVLQATLISSIDNLNVIHPDENSFRVFLASNTMLTMIDVDDNIHVDQTSVIVKGEMNLEGTAKEWVLNHDYAEGFIINDRESIVREVTNKLQEIYPNRHDLVEFVTVGLHTTVLFVIST